MRASMQNERIEGKRGKSVASPRFSKSNLSSKTHETHLSSRHRATTNDGQKFLVSETYTSFTSHETKEFEAELVINPEVLKTVKEGDLMSLYSTPEHQQRVSPEVPRERRLVLKATLSKKSLLNYPFSIHKSVKEAFDLSDTVTMGQVNPRDVQADHVELTIKGQFMPRGDLYRFLNSVNGQTAWGGKVFDVPGLLRARVNQVRRGKQPVYAGVISKQTHVTCRSRSSRIFWLVQLSPEMYDYNQWGDLYYEVFLQFVEEVLDKWRELEVAHSLTVVFFCRSFFRGNKKAEPFLPKRGLFARPVMTAADGKQYEDIYKVVVSNETSAQVGQDLLWRLEDEFNEFPKTMGWFKKVNLDAPTNAAATARPRHRDSVGATRGGIGESCGSSGGAAAEPELDLRDPYVRLSVPAYSSEGNILEALNVTLNVLQKHYMDRDLHRSGNSIVMITAGTGVFNVDGRLSATTTQRMMDNGIGMDMVSLSRPPLHIAPLFISKKRVPIEMGLGTAHEAITAAMARVKEHEQTFSRQYGVDSPLAVGGAGAGGIGAGFRRLSSNSEDAFLQEQPKYEVPHWMNLTFAAGSRPQAGPPKGTPAGLASTTPPESAHAGVNKPTPMPRMVWPAQVSFHPDGTLDMDALYMSKTLRVVVGLGKPNNNLACPAAGGVWARQTALACAGEENEGEMRGVVRPWHIVEEMYPQPPHGIAGAAEFARRLAEARALPPSPQSTLEIATPPFTPGGRRLKSPTGSFASSAGRFTLDTPGTSPSVGYVGSPRSLGRSTLSQVARPWPDRDNFVGAMAQPTLKSSPRNYDPALGKGSGGGGGGGGGSLAELTATGVESSKDVPRHGGSRAEFFRAYSDKKISMEKFQLWLPKFKEYDQQVDQLTEDDTPPHSGTPSRTVIRGDWGSLPVEETPLPISRSSSSGPFSGADLFGSRVPFQANEEHLHHRSIITMPLSSPIGHRESVSGTEIGGSHSSDGGSSVASSPMPRHRVLEDQLSVVVRGREREDSLNLTVGGVSVTASRSPVNTVNTVNTRSWGWGGRRQDLSQPSTSPGNTLWRPLKESNPDVDAKCAAKAERGSGSSTGGEGSYSRGESGNANGSGSGNEGSRGGNEALRSPGGSRSPPQSRLSPQAAGSSVSVSEAASCALATDRPCLSPAGPRSVEGSGSPPSMSLVRSLATKSAGRPIPQAPTHRPRGGPRSALQVKDTISRGRGGEMGVQQGARIPPGKSLPVKIERTSSDGSGGGYAGGRFTAGRRGAPRIMATSAPREGPWKDVDREASAAAAHGYGIVQSQWRGGAQGKAIDGAGWSRLGSSQDSPGSLGNAKQAHPGLKTDVQSRLRRPRPTPVPARSSFDTSGSTHGHLPTGQVLDSAGSAERDVLDREGRHQTIVGSAGSGVFGVGGGGGGGGISGSLKRDLGGSGGRTRTGTVASDAGSGILRAAGRSRVIEVDFNPFKRQDEKELLKSRTHNRRRWTHVFAPGKKEFQTIDTMPGPIWVSLSQPALLPLSIDFLPARNEILEEYLESNYDVDLGGHHTLDSVRPLLEEMVAQRVAQDFQIVEKIGNGPRSSEATNAYGSLASRGRDQQSRKGSATEDGLVHILSMGHRIQTLYYDKTSKILKVRSFTLKACRSTSNAGEDYCYSLWLPIAGHVQTVQQKFHKYPEPEYPFTYMDNLISGDMTELTEGTKFRRLLFNIVPPEIGTAEEEEAFFGAMNKLAEYLNKRKQDAPDVSPVSFKFLRRFGELSDCDGGKGAAADVPMNFRRRTVRMEMTSRPPPPPAPSLHSHASLTCSSCADGNSHSYGYSRDGGREDDGGAMKGKAKVKERGGTGRGRGDEDEDKNQATEEGAKPYCEWLDVCHDELVDVKRVVRLDVRWLLCSAGKVFDYVKDLANCAADINIFLQQVPEYARTKAINLHPFVTHPFIRVPPLSTGDDNRTHQARVLSIVQRYMIETMDFVRCSDVHTDWESFGLTDDSKRSQFGQDIIDIIGRPRDRAEGPLGRVYFHRSGAAFVRVAPGGLVLFQNVHWRDPSGAIALEWGVEDLPRALLKSLQQLVGVLHLIESILHGAIDSAVEASSAGQALRPGSRAPTLEQGSLRSLAPVL